MFLIRRVGRECTIPISFIIRSNGSEFYKEFFAVYLIPAMSDKSFIRQTVISMQNRNQTSSQKADFSLQKNNSKKSKLAWVLS